MSDILRIQNLSFSYQKNVPFLNHCNLTAQEKEIVGILGANGSGKTTLFEILAGQKKRYDGKIFLNGALITSYSLMEKARHIAYIRQIQNQKNAYQDVFHFVLDGRRPYAQLGNYTENDRKIVEKVIAEYRLSALKESRVSLLSGGEFQRCVFARAIAQQTKLIICDEPFSAMDIRYQKELRDKIAYESKHNGTAFLISIHDINLALQFCTKILFLKQGNICFLGSPDEVTGEILEKVYDTKFEAIEHNKRKFFMT